MTYLFIYLTPFLNTVLFEAFFFRADFFYISLALSNVLMFSAIAAVTRKKINSAEFWNFCILPFIFSNFLAIYSLLVINPYIIQFLFAINLFFNFYYLRNIYKGEKSGFLENISSYGNFLAIFFSFSAVYGLRVFLNTPVWILVLVAAAVTILIVHQTFWAYKINFRAGFAYILISCLILVQIAWALYFLPFNYNMLGLILAVCYYMMIGLIKVSFAEKLTSRNLKLYLAFGLGSILIILLTAKWA
jgi:hypothetical protein